MSPVRSPAVAGAFYTADPVELRGEIQLLLSQVPLAEGPHPKALIVPHAGHRYSGPVAASGYALVRGAAVTRVVLLGPAHRLPFRGLATSGAAAFATPLGEVPVERAEVPVLDAAHEREHCLEVQLPFLQVLFDDFRIVPVLVGDATGEEVAAFLERQWGDAGTLVVISSDLSHFYDHDTARRLDRRTAGAITARQAERIGPEDACGCLAIHGLLLVAGRKGLDVREVDLRTSADTAGGPECVVGYGAFALG